MDPIRTPLAETVPGTDACGETTPLTARVTHLRRLDRRVGTAAVPATVWSAEALVLTARPSWIGSRGN